MSRTSNFSSASGSTAGPLWKCMFVIPSSMHRSYSGKTIGSLAFHPRDSPRHSAVYHLNPRMPRSLTWWSTCPRASGARGSMPPSGMSRFGARLTNSALRSGCPGVRVREARAVEVHEHLRGQDRHVVVALDEHSLEVPVRVDLSEGFLVVHRPLRLVHRVEPCLERVKVSMKASPYLFLQSSALASQKPVWASMTNRPSFTGPPWAKPAMRTLPRPARERKRCGGPARAIVNEPGQAGCAGRRAATAAASTPGSRPRRAGAPPLGPDRR